MHATMPESLQAPTMPWSKSLSGLDQVCLAMSGLTPPPMTEHTMPVCLTHWLQGWPDVYQAGDTEPCFVCQRLPRPNADVTELTTAPAATSTLQPVGALSLCQHYMAGPATAHLGLHEGSYPPADCISTVRRCERVSNLHTGQSAARPY